MYAAIISAEPPTANFNRRMGKVFVNREVYVEGPTEIGE
jgi:hypothetical protein